MTGPAGFDARVVELGEALRAEGVAIGTSELNDAFGALAEVSWTRQPEFREALAATLAKSPEDRRVFDLVFDRFFFRAAEEGALQRGISEVPTATPSRRSSSQNCSSFGARPAGPVSSRAP